MGQRILVKTADSLNPSPLAYMKLYNEFEILKDLNLKGVRKVIDLEYKGKTPCLLLEFVEGTTITKYFNEGHFPPGSMGPKVQSVIKFIQNGGKKAIITSFEYLMDALQEKAGTHISG